MSNQYFDWPAKAAADRFVRFTTVRADDVNAAFDEVAAGFEKISYGAYNYGAATGSVNAWAVSMAPTHITAYTDGLTIRVRFPAENTAIEPTLNLNGLGAKIICRDSGNKVAVGDITTGMIGLLTYSATFGKWQLTATSANYDDFNDRYLGAKPSDPIVNNDGGPLDDGTLYWNYVLARLRVYGNSQWNDLVFTVASVQTFTATAAQTVLALASAPPSKSRTQVFINGIYQDKATYALVGSTITLDEGLTAGMQVDVVVL